MPDSLPFRAMETTEADLVAFRDAFGANGFPRDLEQLRWQYFAQPGERLLVDFAVDRGAEGEQIAGIYAALPFTMKLGEETRVAGQALDVLTTAAYRGRGLFTGLARSLYARCASEGLAFIYGFPNANTANGYWTRLDWTSLDPMPFLIRPLRARYLLRRIPGLRAVASRLPDVRFPLPEAPRLETGQEIRTVDTFDERFDDLWEAFSRDIPVAVRRDRRYLQWRYTDKPLEEYHTRGLFRGDRLEGFATYCVKSKHGGVVGYLMELIHDPSIPKASESLARVTAREIAKRGADVILAWNFRHSPNHSAFRAVGFHPFPEWARPIELHFGAHALDSSVHALVTERRNWYLSYSDSDTV
ncbi:MAG: GNAT family N-acetyltransferase [Gemmatimonadota bacterium]|nr:GNAT family N-acetyltransferase [Gemmatimonadota bacterium]MDQ3605971.1 GNAT family N-acetyltransferase [Gemmatimonadota bacterium]